MDITFPLLGVITFGVVTLLASKGLTLSLNESEEYKLRSAIVKNMDPMVRPVKHHSDAVNVSFSMDVLTLTDLDSKRQMLLTNVWIVQRWHNPFLKWKKEDYGSVDRIVVNPTEIWVPDIVLYNNGDKQVRKAGHTELFKNWVVVDSSGRCTWRSIANLESSCNVEVSLFPFDEQNCSLIFVSASYGRKMLEIHSMHPLGRQELGKKQFDDNGEWGFLDMNILKRLSQQHGDTGQEHSLIEYTLKIERRPLYYTMLMIMPCVLCTLLVLASFAIPPENGERIGFCSTVMLSISVYLLIMADMLPEKSDTLPILGIYYIITMFEIALAMIGTITVLRIYHSASEPPNCLKTLYKKRKAKKMKNVRVESKWKITKLFRNNAVDTHNGNTVVSDAEPNVSQVPVDPEPKRAEMKGDGNDIELTEDDNRKIWRSVAVACDRLFFWLFSIIFIGSTASVVKFRGTFKVLFG